MKKIIVLVALAISTIGFAQKTVKEGVITTAQTLSSPDEQVNMQVAMMGQIITTTWFKNDKSRSEMSNPMAGNVIVVMDGTVNKMLVMRDAVSGKQYSVKDMTPSEEELKDVTVVESTETKTVLGYECKKYDVTMVKQGVEVKMAIYTSDKVPAKSQQIVGLGSKVKGYPMFMEMKMNQMGAEIVIKTEVTEIKNEEVADAKFDMTPMEGYEKTERLGM